MTVRSLKSVSGTGRGVEMENGRLTDLMESASQEMKISVVNITYHVKTVDIMTVRSLKSVYGVVAVEMENGRLTDLLESASPETTGIKENAVSIVLVRFVDTIRRSANNPQNVNE